MSFKISGKHMNVGESLTTHAKESLNKLLSKYYGNDSEIAVTIGKESYLYNTEISVHLKHKIVLHAHAEAETPYASFDLAVHKIETQLQKHKEKLHNHHTEHGSS